MYCTIDDIQTQRIDERKLIQLTDDHDMGIVDAAVVESIIAEVSELIDAHLRRHYTLPLSPVPRILSGIALDLCTERLFARRVTLDTPEHVERAHRNAMALLAKIQRGEVSLGVSSPEATLTNDLPEVKAPRETFDQITLDHYLGRY